MEKKTHIHSGKEAIGKWISVLVKGSVALALVLALAAHSPAGGGPVQLAGDNPKCCAGG